MPNGVPDYDFHERLCAVEANVSRLPQIENKLDELHDDMLSLKVERRLIKETTDPGTKFRQTLWERLDLDFGDLIKTGLFLGATIGALWYAKPSQGELKAAVRAHLSEQMEEAKK